MKYLRHGGYGIALRTGHYGAAIFAFGSFLGATLATTGLALMTLAAFGMRDAYGRYLVRTPVFRLAVLLGLVILLRAALASLEEPGLAGEHWSEARRWVMLVLFVPLAYWLARDADRSTFALLLALAGLLLDAVLSLDWSTLLFVLRGGRYGFGFSEVPWGMYSAVAVLGLIVFRGRLTRRPARFRWLRTVAWLVALLFLAQGLLSSQSRGAWIAFAVALPVSLFVLVCARRMSWRRLAIAAAVAALMAAVLFANVDVIADRFAAEQDVLEAIVDGKLDDVRLSSIGLRVRAAQHAFDALTDRPIIGLGPAGARQILLEADDEGVRRLAHLHNGYLEVLTRFGLLGAVLFGGIVGIVLAGLWRGYARGSIAPDQFAFFVGAYLLAAIWSMIDFRLTFSDGRFFWILMLGTSWAIVLRDGLNAALETEAPEANA